MNFFFSVALINLAAIALTLSCPCSQSSALSEDLALSSLPSLYASSPLSVMPPPMFPPPPAFSASPMLPPANLGLLPSGLTLAPPCPAPMLPMCPMKAHSYAPSKVALLLQKFEDLKQKLLLKKTLLCQKFCGGLE